MRNFQRLCRWIGILVGLGMFSLFPAWAHRLNVFAYVDGGQGVVESYFANGDPCVDASVRVLDGEGAVLSEGTTNDQGMYRFPLPEPSDLNIVVQGSLGHENTYHLSKEEILGRPEEMTSDRAEQRSMSSPPEAMASMDTLLDRKLAPLKAELRALRKAQQRTKLQDVLGGIGYIVGIMGFLVLWRTRKERGQG